MSFLIAELALSKYVFLVAVLSTMELVIILKYKSDDELPVKNSLPYPDFFLN